MSNEKVADALDDAADYIERYGWKQGSLGVEDGALQPRCLLGALMCQDEFSVAWDAKTFARRKLADFDQVIVQPALYGSLAIWNDTEGRTKQEVLDFLRYCAKEARK